MPALDGTCLRMGFFFLLLLCISKNLSETLLITLYYFADLCIKEMGLH